MSASTTRERGRPVKPAALKRDRLLRSRVSPIELEAAEARAAMAGLELSAYIRLQCCGSAPEETARHAAEAKQQRTAEDRAPGDFEALVARFARTMPRPNAESLARTELRRRAGQ